MAETYYVLKINYQDKPPETRNIDAQITVIGRDQGDIILGDSQASGRHAEIHFVNGRVTVKDLGSTNGVLFNNVRTPQFAISAGQSFVCGQTTLQLMAIHGGPKAAFGGGKTMISMGAPPMPPRPGGLSPAPGSRIGGAAPPGAKPVFNSPFPPPAASPAPAPAPTPAPAPVAAAPVAAPAPVNPTPAPVDPAPVPTPGLDATAPDPMPSFGAAPSGPGGLGPAPSFGAPPPGGLAPAGGSSLAPSMGGGDAMTRAEFKGTGGDLFVTYLVGSILTGLTFGIYAPWFVVKLRKWQYEHTSANPTPWGPLSITFNGTGGELFVMNLVGVLLSMLTLGIYVPWYLCKVISWQTQSTQFTGADGTRFRLRFKGTGGDLFVTFLVGMLLTMLTVGIYAPWFMVKLTKWFYNNVEIVENETETVGRLDFVGSGGELFVLNLVGALLMGVTLYIYMPWFIVKQKKFFATNTRVQVRDRVYAGDFHGNGGELFGTAVGGFLLTMITAGIYAPWFIVNLLKFNINNTSFQVQPGQSSIGGGGAHGQLTA